MNRIHTMFSLLGVHELRKKIYSTNTHTNFVRATGKAGTFLNGDSIF